MNNQVFELNALDILAKDLAMNMVDVATIDNNENEAAFKLLLNDSLFEDRHSDDSEKYSKRIRNILIIGSGASKDVNKHINTAYDVAQSIVKNNPDLDNKFKEALLRLEANKKDSKAFETILEALSETKDIPFVRNQLKGFLGYKYETSLFYEIVGHMFKHRLIDVIVNYNFDEILDNIIEDEMGNSEYYKILVNGHCPDEYEDLHIGNKLAIPVYIKPHGTISHVGSLKFTDNDYFKASKEKISELLLNLFKENYINSSLELPVNFIAAGYSFNDWDLKHIIKKAYVDNPKKYTFYIFDLKPKATYYTKEFKDFKKDINNPVINYFQIADPDKTLGDIFKEVWIRTSQQFNPEFNSRFPKNIARHELIAKIFHNPNERNPIHLMPEKKKVTAKFYSDNHNKLKDYLEKRILVELAIVIGKSDGILHINQIKESRLKKYCNLYFEKCRENGTYKSLNDFIQKFRVTKFMEVLNDTFIFSDAYTDGIAINYGAIFEDLVAASGDNSIKRTYLKFFIEICKNKLCIVNPDLKEYYVSAFDGLQRKDLLYSDIRWLFKFRNIFRKEAEWNVLLCNSENGEIFNDPYYIAELERRNAVVMIILADYRQNRKEEMLIDLKPNGISKTVIMNERMAWELHNKHMYIFLNVTRDNSNPLYVAGVYYTRRLLSNIVNPVFFEGKDNIKKLFNFFSNYWLNAVLYGEGKSNLKSTPEELEDNKREIIKKLRDLCFQKRVEN